MLVCEVKIMVGIGWRILEKVVVEREIVIFEPEIIEMNMIESHILEYTIK